MRPRVCSPGKGRTAGGNPSCVDRLHRWGHDRRAKRDSSPQTVSTPCPSRRSLPRSAWTITSSRDSIWITLASQKQSPMGGEDRINAVVRMSARGECRQPPLRSTQARKRRAEAPSHGTRCDGDHQVDGCSTSVKGWLPICVRCSLKVTRGPPPARQSGDPGYARSRSDSPSLAGYSSSIHSCSSTDTRSTRTAHR